MRSPLLLTAAACLAFTFSGCSRAPQSAAELLNRMPRQYTGEVHLQGEAEAQPVRIETRQLAARSEHLLEFNGVNVVLLNSNGAVLTEHGFGSRGTISAPGLEIKLEDLGAPEGSDMFKAGTFAGKMSGDLQTVAAEWTTSFGTKGSMKLKAVK